LIYLESSAGYFSPIVEQGRTSSPRKLVVAKPQQSTGDHNRGSAAQRLAGLA
jgi:hypothetical protein